MCQVKGEIDGGLARNCRRIRKEEAASCWKWRRKHEDVTQSVVVFGFRPEAGAGSHPTSAPSPVSPPIRLRYPPGSASVWFRQDPTRHAELFPLMKVKVGRRRRNVLLCLTEEKCLHGLVRFCGFLPGLAWGCDVVKVVTWLWSAILPLPSKQLVHEDCKV